MKTNKKRALVLSITLILAVFLIKGVSAEIILGQTEAEYNVGDDFNISSTIKSSSYSTDFFTADLVCGEQEVNLFRAPYTLNQGEERQIVISTKLARFVVGELSGECAVETKYAGEEVRSQRFILSKNIDVLLSLDNAVFNPGENVRIRGSAKKSRNRDVSGFVEFFVPELNFSFYGAVNVGRFNVSFAIPENSYSGEYALRARVYEKDEAGTIINEGDAEENIRVKQLMKEIGIAVNIDSVDPKNSLDYSIIVYDQANELVDADTGVTIYRPDQSVFENRLVKSGEHNAIEIKANYTPGNWQIYAKLNELEKRKNFYVEELRELDFLLENRTLIIRNIGNVPFSGPIEVSIGEATEIKEISNLEVGVSQRFRLVAPDGEYNIRVGDGTKNQVLGTTFLTGNAISIDEFGKAISNNYWILVWALVILVLAAGIIYFYKNIQRKKAFGEPIFGRTSTKPVSLGAGEVSLAKKLESNKASSVIEKGEKQESAVICLNIKNPEILDIRDSPALKSLDSVLWKAKEAGAKVYSDGNFRVIVFSSALPKDKDNVLRAVSFAQTIERMLREHNKRYAQRISFGIGVNIGSLIVEAQGSKFMSVDNTISSTKRISQHSTGEVLITEAVHRNTAGRIKSEKLGDKALWRVEKVIDRSEHHEFIKRFTEKQSRERLNR